MSINPRRGNENDTKTAYGNISDTVFIVPRWRRSRQYTGGPFIKASGPACANDSLPPDDVSRNRSCLSSVDNIDHATYIIVRVLVRRQIILRRFFSRCLVPYHFLTCFRPEEKSSAAGTVSSRLQPVSSFLIR